VEESKGKIEEWREERRTAGTEGKMTA